MRFRNRLRLAGTSIMVDDITLAAARFAGLTERQLRTRPSTLYNLYQDSFGISVVRTRERLRAVAADARRRRAARHRRQARRCCRSAASRCGYHDEPVEYRVSHVSTAHHEYYAEIGT